MEDSGNSSENESESIEKESEEKIEIVFCANIPSPISGNMQDLQFNKN